MLYLTGLWVWAKIIQRRLERHVGILQDSDNVGSLSGKQIIEQFKESDVRIINVNQRGALFNHRQRTFMISTQHFNARNLDTIWRACHELHHQYQTTKFWTIIFRLEILGEILYGAEAITIGIAALFHYHFGPTSIFGMSGFSALSYFIGDYFPELNAVINTPNNVLKYGNCFVPLSESTVESKVLTDLLRYFFASLTFAIGLTLAVAFVAILCRAI